MKKKNLKTVLAISTSFVLLSSSLSFAAPVFKDIDEHWAKEYVEDVYQRKIISGYEDGTYRPGGNITKLEAAIISAKLMGYRNSESQYYINQYSRELSNNNIPSWAQGEVAYALFNDIISKDDLQNLVSTNTQTYAKRKDIATYIGRVLEYGAGEEIKSIYVIPYNDELKIPQETRPYVDLLLRNDILDKDSNNGRFLPEEAITRAEVAKIISLSAKILDSNASGYTPPTSAEDDNSESDRDVEVKRVSGHIESILKGNKNVLSVIDGHKTYIHNIDEDAKITLENRNVTADSLKEGQNVAIVIEDDIIVSIEAFEAEEVTEGYFFYFLTGQEDQVHITDEDDQAIKFVFTNNSKVYLGDKLIDVRDIKYEDVVTIRHMDEEIIEIEVEPKEKTLEGIVKDIYEYDDEYILEVLLEDDTIEEFVIDSDAKIRRDSKSIDFDEIKIEDKVEIELEYDEVIKVNAYSVQKTIEGFIQGIVNFSDRNEITVEDYDGNIETFALPREARIILDKERAAISDLKPGYEVEIDLENNETILVEGYSKMRSFLDIGTVSYVDHRDGILEIEINRKEEMEVEVDRETLVIDEYGQMIRLRDLSRNDDILVYGEDRGYYILAKRILVL